MSDPSSVLFVSRYYWPELIGSAPFSTDIAEWLAAHGRPTTMVSGLPHYPHDDVFPAYRDRRCVRETVCGVAVERLSAAAPMRVAAATDPDRNRRHHRAAMTVAMHTEYSAS